jgi:uncharacterized protein (TIGR02453 family)
MPWFTTDAINFFLELEANNNRDWFEANKKRYLKSVKQPMEAFAGEMIERMKAIDPAISMEPKQAVFRIYRDTRFAKDKTPYKTNAGLSISSGGKTDFDNPGLYFHIDANSMGIATGFYMLEPHKLKAMREYIAENLDEFETQLADKKFKEFFGTIRGEKNKVLPAELKEAAARQPLLFNKQFYYWSEHDPENITHDDLPDFVMERIYAAQPMNKFLAKAIRP